MKNEIRTRSQRTYAQIEKDYREWRAVLISNDDITSWNSLATRLEVSVHKVHHTFNRHPKSKKQLQTLMDTRKRSRKATATVDTTVTTTAVEAKATEVVDATPAIVADVTEVVETTPAIVADVTEVVETTPAIVAEENGEFKRITICDISALMHGFQSCIVEPITIPVIVMTNLEKISKHHYDVANAKKAIKALSYIGALYDWATVVPNAYPAKEMAVPDSSANWPNKIVTALACRYAKNGYHVTVKTRSAHLFHLIKRQGIEDIVATFVPEDPALV